MRLLFLALPLLPLSCGGPTFSSSTGLTDSGSPPHPDASTPDSSSTSDSSPPDSASSDAPSPPADAGPCAPLTSASTDIYVDPRFTGSPRTGAEACPLPTILAGITAATTLGGARTVHVAGAIPALVYDESTSITVGSGITLVGGGALQTTIVAAGPCTSSGTCAVLVEPGGILDGAAVVSHAGDGIWTTAGSPQPIVRNAAADGSTGNGIVALGSVQLGPNISASNNGKAGVESPAMSTGTVHVVVGLNTFDKNGGNGLDFSGGAGLLFEGGSASNEGQGIRLASTPPTSHSISSLTAKNDTGPGAVVVYGGQTLKLRSSTLLSNTNTGLLYDYVNGSALDLGTASDPGKNVFGGATAKNRNGTAGITLCSVPSTVSASADSWSTCPPSQTAIVCGQTLVSTYTDVAYQGSGATVNPVSGSCTVGP